MERVGGGGGEGGRGGRGGRGEVKKYLISQTTSFWKQVIPDRVAIIFRCERGRKCNQRIAHRDLEFG